MTMTDVKKLDLPFADLYKGNVHSHPARTDRSPKPGDGPQAYSDFSKSIDALDFHKASSIAPLPKTPNAQRMTTGVRFVITEDTFKRYPADDVMNEKIDLVEAGMWHLPNGGEPFTIRIKYSDLGTFFQSVIGDNDETSRVHWENEKQAETDAGYDRWLDFDMRGDELIGCCSVVYRRQMPGNVDKQWYIENDPFTFNSDNLHDSGFDFASRQAWWEKGNWFNQRYSTASEPLGLISENLLDILVLSLMDSSVVQERTVREKLTPKQARTSPFRPGGPLYSPEQDVQEVTIRCPGYYREHGERGEPTGRKVKMHRRRGHVRTLHRGQPEQRTIYIQPVWVNAKAGVVPPPVSYTVT